ncbi:hypothetical protein ANCDUO_06074 [Ancylostoma duodenale]|uniref:Uncharacterized protein n=1 Tax=Ancylostoma duodenale TaxID=51022 RepID=A0A0C2H2H1_9BILA|nr:hypothetical protein ANCDUO_06074 [Ancylostoma duodenale]
MEDDSDVEQGPGTRREEPSNWWLITAILAIAVLAVVAVAIPFVTKDKGGSTKN